MKAYVHNTVLFMSCTLDIYTAWRQLQLSFLVSVFNTGERRQQPAAGSRRMSRQEKADHELFDEVKIKVT